VFNMSYYALLYLLTLMFCCSKLSVVVLQGKKKLVKILIIKNGGVLSILVETLE
jgi:hypothetical protein